MEALDQRQATKLDGGQRFGADSLSRGRVHGRATHRDEHEVWWVTDSVYWVANPSPTPALIRVNTVMTSAAAATVAGWNPFLSLASSTIRRSDHPGVEDSRTCVPR